ncbi:hypothetical protein SsS58_00798 [Streptomyces scabiei]|uniref:Uncharacterized protein n=1 Tax=Streptomyces scabiei TaxID=1930 RepID=A0A124C378_STRSC|nr:hypothetical protein SsS58_00798 [Streptomyces scabiei]
MLEKTGLVNHDQVNYQQTNPPKLPGEQVTPPVPQQGAPMVVLTPRPELNVQTAAPTAAPAPTPSGSYATCSTSPARVVLPQPRQIRVRRGPSGLVTENS